MKIVRGNRCSTTVTNESSGLVMVVTAERCSILIGRRKRDVLREMMRSEGSLVR